MGLKRYYIKHGKIMTGILKASAVILGKYFVQTQRSSAPVRIDLGGWTTVIVKRSDFQGVVTLHPTACVWESL